MALGPLSSKSRRERAIRDFAIRFGILLGLLAGGAAHDVGGWLVVGFYAVVTVIFMVGGLIYSTWREVREMETQRASDY